MREDHYGYDYKDWNNRDCVGDNTFSNLAGSDCVDIAAYQRNTNYVDGVLDDSAVADSDRAHCKETCSEIQRGARIRLCA